MAKDAKEVEHKCVYLGSHDNAAMEPVEQSPTPPAIEFVRSLALSLIGGVRGRFRRSIHFAHQVIEREFDVFDMEYAIRNGDCVGGGIYCPDNRDYKYTFRACIDGVDFDAVFALSAEHDLIASPLWILVTGCWKTKTGKRTKRY
jgi:hypothetical protein